MKMQTDLQHAVFSNRQCAAAISASGLNVTDGMLTAWIALVWFLPLSHPLSLFIMDMPFWDGI